MALYKRSGMSVASLLTFQLTAQSVDMTVTGNISQIKYGARILEEIDDLYTMCDIKNSIKDGTEPYPSAPKTEKGKEAVSTQKGAKVEFRLV